jgi:hypothetical protein
VAPHGVNAPDPPSSPSSLTQPSLFSPLVTPFLTLQLISEGLGLVCAIVTRTATYAIIILTFLLLLLLSFTGFLVTRVRPRSDLI